MLLATRPQVNRAVTVNSRLANRAVNRAFLQPALNHSHYAAVICTLVDLSVTAIHLVSQTGRVAGTLG